eukprot:406453_1
MSASILFWLITLWFNSSCGQDPFCENGIANSGKTYCCAASCGACGGSGCNSRPGGNTNCCQSKIVAAGKSCDEYDAPCLIEPYYCDSIYGGGWSLVRHSYNGWHPATDDVLGTDEYGVFDNNPKSFNTWTIPYNNALEDDGSTLFMFSNGGCSEFLVAEHKQFNTSRD